MQRVLPGEAAARAHGHARAAPPPDAPGHGCYPDGGAYYLYNYPGSEFWLAGDYDPPIHYNYRYAAQSYYDCCCDDTPGVCVEGDIGFEETEPSGD